MFVRFDPNKMEIYVICGPGDTYVPSSKSLEAHEKVKELKEKMSEFMEKTVGPGVEEINKIVSELNEPFVAKEEENKDS